MRRLSRKDPTLAPCHYYYRTPLYFAVRENRLRAASLLLGFPGDPLSLPVNDTLLTVARDRGYTEMRKLLEERLDGRGNQPIHWAVMRLGHGRGAVMDGV